MSSEHRRCRRLTCAAALRPPPRACSVSTPTHTVKFAFDLFDNDGGGTIAKNEIRQLVSLVIGGKDIDKKVKDLLGKMDEDGDGEVTLEEFRSACCRPQARVSIATPTPQRTHMVCGLDVR